MLFTLFFSAAIVFGAVGDSDAENDALRPPYAEMPPTFWEQYGARMVTGGILLFALAALLVWLLSRPNPPVVVPPEKQARQALDSLRKLPEDGATLSRVSQVLRRYVAAAFGLPPAELTTAEFCRAVSEQQQVGADLSAALGDFLRQCDERKFAPPVEPPTIGVVARALTLVDLSEARRAQLRQTALAHAAGQPARNT